MLQHYPDDEVIFEHYVDRADPERGFGRSDDVPATFLILKGYTSRPQAREYLLKLLNPAPETPFARSPTLLTDHVPWEEIATTFADDAEVVAAIRALARKHVASPIGERDLYFCSAVVSEDWLRDHLLERVGRRDAWGVGWAIRALAERWPEDEAVQSTLASLVNPDDGPISDSAIWRLSSIIADAEAALDRLAAIAPDHDGQAAVVDALRDLIERGVNRHDDRVTTILDAAIAHDMASPWTSPEAALYVGFADDDRVRAMAMGRLGDRGAPLGAIAYGFAHDADVRKALARGLRPLSPPLRGRLVEALAEASTTDEDVTTLLSRYDAESDAVVKILSAAAFARRLQAAEAVTDAVVAQFTEQARALGHDHDERRAAAFCAIAELGRLDVLVDLRDRVTPDQSRSRTLPSATEASSSDSYVASGRTSKQRSARSSRTDSATVTAVTPSSGPTS